MLTTRSISILYFVIVLSLIIYSIIKIHPTAFKTPPPSSPYYECNSTTNQCVASQTSSPTSYPDLATCQSACNYKPQWGCEYVVANDNTTPKTGNCILYKQPGLGSFATQHECQVSGQCILPQSVSCAMNGKCSVTCSGTNCPLPRTNPPSDLKAWTDCLATCTATQPIGKACTQNSDCNQAGCEVCFQGHCLNNCASLKSSPCPNGDGTFSLCPPGTNQCPGLWCKNSATGQYTACPTTNGLCSDGTQCQTVACTNVDCGICLEGKCQASPTLCNAGFKCAKPDGSLCSNYPDPTCSRQESNCPPGYNSDQTFSPTFVCPNDLSLNGHFCNPVNKQCTCSDGSLAVDCWSMPNMPVSCCGCKPNP